MKIFAVKHSNGTRITVTITTDHCELIYEPLFLEGVEDDFSVDLLA